MIQLETVSRKTAFNFTGFYLGCQEGICLPMDGKFGAGWLYIHARKIHRKQSGYEVHESPVITEVEGDTTRHRN